MAQLYKPAGHGLRQQPVRSRSPIALDGWPWSIRRKFQNLQVDHGEVDRLALGNDLARPSIHRDKCRAQRLMADDDSLQRAPQCAEVERALHPHCRGDAIERTVGLQLSQEPQPLLGEGQRATVRLCPSRYPAWMGNHRYAQSSPLPRSTRFTTSSNLSPTRRIE